MKIFFSGEGKKGDACTKYRALLPAKALASLGHRCTFSYLWQPDFIQHDVFVFQRNSSEMTLPLINALRKEGKTAVYDLDDNLLQMPSDNPHRPDVGRMLDALAAASFVTTTTHPLKTLLGDLFPDVRAVPNYIDLSEWANNVELPAMRIERTIVLGWAGSPTHRNSLNLLRAVLPPLLEKYPQVSCIFMGMDPPFPLPAGRSTTFGWSNYQNYQTVLRSFDIALAPLVENPFNLCKSSLRLLEYAAAGLPIVSSGVGEYMLADELGGVFLRNEPQVWIENLAYLIERESLRKERGAYALESVAAFDILLNARAWERTLCQASA